MMPTLRTLTIERTVAAPLEDVYRACISAPMLRAWLCDAAQIEPHVNGRLSLWWNDGFYASGIFITLIPNEQLAIAWHGRAEPAPTNIQISLLA